MKGPASGDWRPRNGMGGVCTSLDEEIRAREGCDVVTNIKKGSRVMMSGTVNVGLCLAREQREALSSKLGSRFRAHKLSAASS